MCFCVALALALILNLPALALGFGFGGTRIVTSPPTHRHVPPSSPPLTRLSARPTDESFSLLKTS